jgi:hypothetical protein
MERLFNTGDYTSVKYSVGCEVPEGASAKQALLSLEKILKYVMPEKVSDWTLKQSRELYQKWIQDPESLTESQKAEVPAAEAFLAKVELNKTLRKEALAALDTLGGEVEHKDAKKKWDEDTYDDAWEEEA